MTNNNKKIAEDIAFKGETPGQLLAQGRKRVKLSEREAADGLKISVSRLKSIEEDDFSVFPSETYIRGHLRNYSRLLKEDEQKILGAYDSTKPVGDTPESSEMREDAIPVNNTHKKWWIVYIVLVVLALIWVLSYWILGSNDEPLSGLEPGARQDEAIIEEPVINKEPVEIGVDTPIVLPPESLVASNDDASDDQLAIVTNNFSSSSLAQGSTEINGNADNKGEPIVVSQLTASELVKSIKAKEQIQNAEPQKVIEGDTLEFGFVNSSWIQVTDASGTVLFKGLNKPGAELALNGKAPFRVVIGNVEGTSLVYNGELVSLDAPSGKNTLRLILGG